MTQDWMSKYSLHETQITELNFYADTEKINEDQQAKMISIGLEFTPSEVSASNDNSVPAKAYFRVKYESYSIEYSEITEHDKPDVLVEVSLRGLVVGMNEDASSDNDIFEQKAFAVDALYSVAKTHIASLTSISAVDKIELPNIEPRVYVENLEELE